MIREKGTAARRPPRLLRRGARATGPGIAAGHGPAWPESGDFACPAIIHKARPWPFSLSHPPIRGHAAITPALTGAFDLFS